MKTRKSYHGPEPATCAAIWFVPARRRMRRRMRPSSRFAAGGVFLAFWGGFPLSSRLGESPQDHTDEAELLFSPLGLLARQCPQLGL